MKENGTNIFMPVVAAIGGLIGATIALLLAPQSGRESRKQVRENYDKAEKGINNVIKKVDETLPEALAKITSEVKDMPAWVVNDLTHIKKDSEKKFDNAVNKGKDIIQDIKDSTLSTIEQGKKLIKK